MSTLIINNILLNKLFFTWSIRHNQNSQYTISQETKILSDMQSGVVSDKVFIYDLIKKTWLTQPKSKSQLAKYLIETM